MCCVRKSLRPSVRADEWVGYTFDPPLDGGVILLLLQTVNRALWPLRCIADENIRIRRDVVGVVFNYLVLNTAVLLAWLTGGRFLLLMLIHHITRALFLHCCIPAYMLPATGHCAVNNHRTTRPGQVTDLAGKYVLSRDTALACQRG